MQPGTIFSASEYAKAYEYAEFAGLTIKSLENGLFQIVEFDPIHEKTNEDIEAIRKDLYTQEVDPLMAEYNRKKLFDLFDEGEEEVLLEAIQNKVAEIKEQNPYIVEEPVYEDIEEELIAYDDIEELESRTAEEDVVLEDSKIEEDLELDSTEKDIEELLEEK